LYGSQGEADLTCEFSRAMSLIMEMSMMKVKVKVKVKSDGELMNLNWIAAEF
jgi:predicted double-glycine peptidase